MTTERSEVVTSAHARPATDPDDVLSPPRPRLPPAAAGRLTSLADSVTIGLVVVAGAGSWLAANQAFAGRRRAGADWGALALLGVLTLASTLGAVWLGARIGDALTLHVLPKGAGLVLFLVGAEVAGVRLPKAGRLPLPLAALGAVLALEVGLQWTA